MFLNMYTINKKNTEKFACILDNNIILILTIVKKKNVSPEIEINLFY